MFFSFLYSFTVHNSPYLFHLYTTSLHTYIKLVIFLAKYSLETVYMTTQHSSSQLVIIKYLFHISGKKNVQNSKIIYF